MGVGQEQPLSGGGSGDGFALLACIRCRSRKLKCDRKRPRCNRCVKRDEACSYPGSRQRGLGSRKTVRELEERIEELESLLREANIGGGKAQEAPTSCLNSGPPLAFDSGQLDPFTPPPSVDHVPLMVAGGTNLPPYSGGQLISLGLFEQLPSFDIIDNLTSLYFQIVHDGAPMLHQASYTLALRFPPPVRPPMCLQYIVMALAAAMSDVYRHLSEPFYQRARVYAEADEMRTPGEIFATVAHAQCWCLIAAYECHAYAMYTRASTSLCRSVRIAQMLGLHKLDSSDPEPLRSGLPPPRSWTEAEERRRTWWTIFLADCYLTAVTGWPSLIDVRHIRTNLPSAEERFNGGTGAGGSPVNGASVPFSRGVDVLRQGPGIGEVSPLAVRILAANELLRALDHTASDPSAAPVPGQAEDVHQQGGTAARWQQHLRQIDDNLITLAAALPEKLDPSRNPQSLDAILVHTCANMAAIHLHRAALRRHYLYLFQHNHHFRDPPAAAMVAHSRARLLSAADGILAVFRAAGAVLGAALQNPLLPFAAYLAASVFLEDHVRVTAALVTGEGGQGTCAPAETGQQRRRRQTSEDKLTHLARVLVLYGRSSPLVRANAAQLATDMRHAGYDASTIEQALGPLETWGAPPPPASLPTAAAAAAAAGAVWLFCPPVASAPGLVGVEDLGIGGGVDLGNHHNHHHGGFPVLSFQGLVKSGPCTPSSTVVPSMLKACTPRGLFSEIVPEPGHSGGPG
ncbi:hypothetical protein VTH06DRAFT_6273 [Thermothelomyces fergusii]